MAAQFWLQIMLSNLFTVWSIGTTSYGLGILAHTSQSVSYQAIRPVLFIVLGFVTLCLAVYSLNHLKSYQPRLWQVHSFRKMWALPMILLLVLTLFWAFW